MMRFFLVPGSLDLRVVLHDIPAEDQGNAVPCGNGVPRKPQLGFRCQREKDEQ